MIRHAIGLMLIVIILTTLLGCGGGGSSSNNVAWTLVWEDDFVSDTLNAEDWNPAVQGLSWNNEDQAYIAENVTVEGGLLVLTAKKEHWEGLSRRVDNPEQWVSQEYTSGEVNTRRSWTYGRFEIKAKFPKTQGILSAFWATPLDGDWPPEIDIVEMLGHEPQTLYFTNHYGTAQNHQMTNGNYRGADYSEDFHVYAMEWEPNVIRWYVDGVKRFESTNGVPSEPFILRLSLPVGPDWEGNPTTNSVFPQRLEVDWVRVYQRSNN